MRERRAAARVEQGLPSREEALVAREIEQAESKIQELIERGEDASVNVQLTPLGLGILAHVQRQTGERRRDIFERLLRDHGTEVAA